MEGIVSSVVSEEDEGGVGRKDVVRTGVGFGSALAIAISWSQHQSILWAIIHGALSWLYVIYYAFTR